MTACGICIDGINLDEKKPDFSKIETVGVSYPDNPAMLTGLKIMAIAQKEFGANNTNEDVLLRCDYRGLINDEPEADSMLKYIIKPLSVDVQDFVLKLHQRYMDEEVNCDLVIKDFWFKFIYTYKKKEIWTLNISLNNGFGIGIRAKNIGNYADTVEKFSSRLRDMIAKGYGCGKKRGITDKCDGGCRGYRIALDESVLEIGSDIETWFGKELSFMKGK
jgi:hypothetical protein